MGESTSGERVDFNQWIVMCDGTHVGYLQKTDGAWLQCIVFMDDATKDEFIAAVSAAAHQKIGGAAVPVDPDFLTNDEGEDEDE